MGLTQVYADEASVVFKVGDTMINCLASSAASDLVEPLSLGVAGSPRAVYTIKCSDVDAAVAELQAAGVTLLNGPIDRPWGVRTASFLDPSGHIWELANHD